MDWLSRYKLLTAVPCTSSNVSLDQPSKSIYPDFLGIGAQKSYMTIWPDIRRSGCRRQRKSTISTGQMFRLVRACSATPSGCTRDGRFLEKTPSLGGGTDINRPREPRYQYNY